MFKRLHLDVHYEIYIYICLHILLQGLLSSIIAGSTSRRQLNLQSQTPLLIHIPRAVATSIHYTSL